MQIKSITKGNILIAQPSVIDLTFNRTVLYVIDHNEFGSMGFILNKPIKHAINLYVPELESDFQVYEGGPVEMQNIYYLHRRPDLIANSEHIGGEIYWSGNYADVKFAINEGLIAENEIRFCLGYSGWAEGQLQEEVDHQAWIVLENNIDIFQEWDADLWKMHLKNLGGEHLIWLNTPEDPSMN